MTLQPSGHLRIVFTLATRAIGLLGKIDVESLGGFCIEAVKATKLADGNDIVEEGVELRYVEVLADSEIDEDIFVLMELVEGVVHAGESVIRVGVVLREVDELEQGTTCTRDGGVNTPSNETKEHLLDLLGLRAVVTFCGVG